MVNLFADMGIQPGTLQSGLVAATPSTDRYSSDLHHQFACVRFNVGDYGHDFRHGLGRWRRDRRRRGLDRQRCDLASGDRRRDLDAIAGSPQVAGTYTIKSRAVDDSINLETPSAGRTVTVTAPATYPVPRLGNSGHREHDRSGRGRARREVSVLGRRHRQRYPLLQEQPGHRHPHRRAMVEHRHEAGDRHLHQRVRERLAERDFLPI